MFAEHQDCFTGSFLFKGGSNPFHPMLMIETESFLVHHIAQISQFLFRESMMSNGKYGYFCRIIDAARFQQFFHSPAAQVSNFRRRNEPVIRQDQIQTCTFKGSISQFAQLVAQVVCLRSAGQFFHTRQDYTDAVVVFVLQTQRKAEIVFSQCHGYGNLPFGRLLLHLLLKLLVKVPVQHGLRLHTRHFLREELVVFHPVYTESLQTALLIKKAYAVAVAKGFHTCHCQVITADFLDGSHLLTQRLGGIKRENAGIFSFDTPKSLGEEMGTVKEIRGNYLTVAGVKPFSNGDGICFLDEQGRLQGFRVNRVENNKLFPQEMPRVKPKTVLYRNFDQEFEKQMQKKSAERKIAVSMTLAENNFGFTLSLEDEDDNRISVVLPRVKELARTPQADNLRNQLGKLGNTPFECTRLDLVLTDNWFIPSSEIADLRRRAVEKLLEARRINYPAEIAVLPVTHHAFPEKELTYLGNVMNKEAFGFYHQHGVKRIAPAFEQEAPREAVLMFCKHCIRYSMGWCPQHQKVRSPYREPFYLVSGDGRRFRLQFDCKACQMKVMAEE